MTVPVTVWFQRPYATQLVEFLFTFCDSYGVTKTSFKFSQKHLQNSLINPLFPGVFSCTFFWVSLKIVLLHVYSDIKWFFLLSVVTSLIYLYFLTLYTVFPKTELFTNLKKIFFKILFSICFSSTFIQMYGLKQYFWLNLIVLWTFCNNNLWLNALF